MRIYIYIYAYINKTHTHIHIHTYPTPGGAPDVLADPLPLRGDVRIALPLV